MDPRFVRIISIKNSVKSAAVLFFASIIDVKYIAKIVVVLVFVNIIDGTLSAKNVMGRYFVSINRENTYVNLAEANMFANHLGAKQL